MRSDIRIILALLVAQTLPPSGALAQRPSPPSRATIDGSVTDSSLAPLGGATITLLGSPIAATTAESGRFRVTALPAGEYVILVRRLGYASASASLHLGEGDTLRPAFALRRAVAALDTMRTSATSAPTRLGEFEERRARQVGHFITQDEIEKRGPISIADMLRSVLSVGISEGGARRMAYSLRAPGRCPFQVFVDGQVFSERGDLTTAPAPKEIAGVEIYSGPATIPLEYKRHDTMCGVILIWTRSGS